MNILKGQNPLFTSVALIIFYAVAFNHNKFGLCWLRTSIIRSIKWCAVENAKAALNLFYNFEAICDSLKKVAKKEIFLNDFPWKSSHEKLRECSISVKAVFTLSAIIHTFDNDNFINPSSAFSFVYHCWHRLRIVCLVWKDKHSILFVKSKFYEKMIHLKSRNYKKDESIFNSWKRSYLFTKPLWLGARPGVRTQQLSYFRP